MRKRLLTLALALLCLPLMARAEGLPSIRTLFIEAPTTVVPLLNEQHREQMVVAFENKRGEKTHNLLGAECFVEQLTDSFIEVVLDSETRLQMKVLPLPKKGYVVCVNYTQFATPPRISALAFYNSKWEQQPTSHHLRLPSSVLFLPQPANLHHPEVRKCLGERSDFMFEASLTPYASTLTLRATTLDTPEMAQLYPTVKQFLEEKNGVHYTWQEGVFTLTELRN